MPEEKPRPDDPGDLPVNPVNREWENPVMEKEKGFVSISGLGRHIPADPKLPAPSVEVTKNSRGEVSPAQTAQPRLPRPSAEKEIEK